MDFERTYGQIQAESALRFGAAIPLQQQSGHLGHKIGSSTRKKTEFFIIYLRTLMSLSMTSRAWTYNSRIRHSATVGVSWSQNGVQPCATINTHLDSYNSDQFAPIPLGQSTTNHFRILVQHLNPLFFYNFETAFITLFNFGKALFTFCSPRQLA